MNGIGHAIFDGWPQSVYAAVKTLLLFITETAAFRLTERRTIAEFTPFDWVTAVAAGSIVGRAATASDTSWATAAAALATLIAAHAVIARLRFVGWIRRIVDPPVRILIRDGTVDNTNLRRCRLTRADLDAILRQHGFTEANGVGLALFESKGSVSLFPRALPDPDRRARQPDSE